MRLAIVGSRHGVSQDRVERYLDELHAKHPDVVVVSGGAEGVDTFAEQGWLKRGGRVVSLRPKRTDEGYVIEEWRLPDGGVHSQLVPAFADRAGACIYRDLMIAERCDRLTAFMRRGGSNGTRITIGFAKDEGKPVSEFEERE